MSEAREVIFNAIAVADKHAISGNTYYYLTDYALTALEAKGFRIAGPDEVVVERERFERVRRGHMRARGAYKTGVEQQFYMRSLGLEDGDLDPLPEVER